MLEDAQQEPASTSFIQPTITPAPKQRGRKKAEPGEIRIMIKWNEDEYGLVVDKVRELRAANKKTSKETAIKKAMTFLPNSRARPFSSALVGAISKRINALEAFEATEEGKAASAAAEEAAKPKAPAIDPAMAAAAQKVLDTLSETDEIPIAPGETLLKELTIGLASVFAGALSQPSVKEAIKGLIRDVMGATQPNEIDPLDFRWTDPVQIAGIERKRQLRVLIGGLIGPQMQTLTARFGKQFDLRFWSVDKSPDTLRHLSSNADVTIGFINFIGHQHEQIMKTRSKSYLRCTGGMTKLSDMIEKLPATMHMN